MNERERLSTVRLNIGITLILLIIGMYQSILLARKLHVTTGSVKWMATFSIGGLGLLLAFIIFLLTWTSRQQLLLRFLAWGERSLKKVRLLLIPLLVILIGLFPFLLLDPTAEFFKLFSTRVNLLWVFVLSGTIILRVFLPETKWDRLLLSVILVFTVVYRLAMFIPDVSGYPFSLTWSEASRYYYASLFFSDLIYGRHVNPTVLHPTRYMLQALPFLLSNSPLWLHRFWQVLLWIVSNFLTAALLVRRLSLPTKQLGFFVGLWAFLFLFQGPVWYHLLVMVIFILGGFDRQSVWKSFIFVLFASIWAGMSRINWIPFPGVLAAFLYFLEQKVEKQSIYRYLFPPVLWVLTGTLAGLVSQVGYAVLSGNEIGQFGSSLTSDLLWYRLFPNVTYPLGVLPGIILVSFPIFLVVYEYMQRRLQNIHPIRYLGVGIILTTFFAGGLIVSAKIGGGSNLHNLDGYITLLMVLGAYIYFDRVSIMKFDITDSSPKVKINLVSLVLAIIIPVGFTIQISRSYDLADNQDSQRALSKIRTSVSETVARGEQVLFIAERHLLTFGEVEKTPLVEDYEKVFLMEMAMAGNLEYLSRFQDDLASKRFGLIVASPTRIKIQDRENDFSEENNAWVRHISVPLLCYYEESLLLDDVKVQLFVPRANIGDCDFSE